MYNDVSSCCMQLYPYTAAALLSTNRLQSNIDRWKPENGVWDVKPYTLRTTLGRQLADILRNKHIILLNTGSCAVDLVCLQSSLATWWQHNNCGCNNRLYCHLPEWGVINILAWECHVWSHDTYVSPTLERPAVLLSTYSQGKNLTLCLKLMAGDVTHWGC